MKKGLKVSGVSLKLNGKTSKIIWVVQTSLCQGEVVCGKTVKDCSDGHMAQMASYGGATGTLYEGYTTYPANGDQVRFAFTYIHPCKTNMFGFSPSVHGKF